MNTRQSTKQAGDFDPEFGTNGIALLPGELPNAWSGLLSDGKFLTGSRMGPDLVLLRHLDNGEPDTSFGENGVKRVYAVTPSDGVKLAVFSDDSALLYTKTMGSSGEEIILVRTLPDGNLDTGFGNDGVLTFSIGLGINQPGRALMQDDGKILLSVTVGYPPSHDDAFLVRLDNGNFDPDFGDNGTGITFIGTNRTVRDLLVLPDDHLFLAGFMDYSVLFMQRMPDGSADPAFGTDGTVLLNFGNYPSANIERIARQADGKIVAVGGVNVTVFDSATLTIRITQDGQMDRTFNNGAPIIIRFDGVTSQQYAVEIQADNKILSAGQLFGETQASDFLLMRFLPDGTLDPAFGTDGKSLSNWGGLEILDDMALQPDGKAVIFGDVIDMDAGVRRKMIVRYLTSST
ncbi:MAG TPA: hypothetical protein DIT18_16355 [Pseudomonas sp.]|nr:hypothetical protein [Pseudomonas sp.]